jgi:hypothetical protein
MPAVTAHAIAPGVGRAGFPAAAVRSVSGRVAHRGSSSASRHGRVLTTARYPVAAGESAAEVTPGQDWTNRTTCPPRGLYKLDDKTGTRTETFGKQDADVTGDGRKDWFIGETRFVEAGPPKKDVIVQEWCINMPPEAVNNAGKTQWFFHDYFTLRVLTSFGDQKEVVALPAGLHFCPFFGGQNSGARVSGKLIKNLPDGDLTKLPTRIDWISNNGDIAKRGAAAYRPKDLAEKTIIWIFPKNIGEKTSNGAVVAGKIIVKDGATDPQKAGDVPADAFPPDEEGQPPNMYSVPDGAAPRPANKLDPDEKLKLYQDAVAEYKANKKRYEAQPTGSLPAHDSRFSPIAAGIPVPPAAADIVQDITPSGGPAGPAVPAPVTVEVSNEGPGSGVTSDPTGFEVYCYDSCTATLPSGQETTLYAEPFAGSVFAGWSGACSGTAVVCQFTATAGAQVMALYTPVKIKPAAEPERTGSTGVGTGSTEYLLDQFWVDYHATAKAVAPALG